MIKKEIGIIITGNLLLLSSCHLYQKAERTEFSQEQMQALVRDTTLTDSSSITDLKWQEFFTDPQLQTLINSALENNYDLRACLQQTLIAEAQLQQSKGAFSPSLSFAPNGTLSSFDGSTTKLYQIPLTADWEIPIFGGLLNSKRAADSRYKLVQSQKQAIRSQLIATVANTYYNLIMLDQQISITEQTIAIWKQNEQMLRDLKTIGRSNEAGVCQSVANRLSIELSVADLKQQRKAAENQLCVLTGKNAQNISRGNFTDAQWPTYIKVGVPAQMLANRQDVEMAQQQLAAAYYATNIARSAFYPNLTLNGTFGWSNYSGDYIINPAKMLASATGALLWPLWNKGRNKANLKTAKAEQETARLAFQQAVLNAGAEVSTALSAYQTAESKSEKRQQQVTALQKAQDYTLELYKLSTTSYLEVLTAEQGLLQAQLGQESDRLQKVQALIQLYQTLGGGKN